MSIEVRPFGVKCNIACQYCYQHPERDAGNELHSYDLEKITGVLAKSKKLFTLFGGEPLMTPLPDLEKLLELGMRLHGGNNLQTNGALITERHIELFKTYNVRVGISVDGPGELNDVRWAGSLERTRRATERTHGAIRLLCASGRPPSLIITLHRNNATRDKFETMEAWLRELDDLGVRIARLHLLEIDDDQVRDKYALSTEENIEVISFFEDVERKLPHLRFDMFTDMRNMLLGQDKRATCIWTGCDPYTTEAVQGLEGNGQISNCGRTNKDGVDFVKSDSQGFERYLALYQTPQDDGGCKDCRFFLMCKGQCPGTSVGGDWRNRTELCEVIKFVYGKLERELLDQGLYPLSAQPLRKELESDFQALWRKGKHTTIHHLLKLRTQKHPQPN